MHPNRLLAELSSREIAGWMAYYNQQAKASEHGDLAVTSADDIREVLGKWR